MLQSLQLELLILAQWCTMTIQKGPFLPKGTGISEPILLNISHSHAKTAEPRITKFHRPAHQLFIVYLTSRGWGHQGPTIFPHVLSVSNCLVQFYNIFVEFDNNLALLTPLFKRVFYGACVGDIYLFIWRKQQRACYTTDMLYSKRNKPHSQ